MSVSPTTTVGALQAQERTVEDLFKSAEPSIVSISTFVKGMDRLTMNAVEVPAGTGSGFVWDDKGNVVTNYHVIRGAQSAMVAVTGADGTVKQYNANLVGFNPDKDVAVLRVDAAMAPAPLKIGSSDALRVGQTCLAIGNPFGLDHSLSVGVISGVGREVRIASNFETTVGTCREMRVL